MLRSMINFEYMKNSVLLVSFLAWFNTVQAQIVNIERFRYTTDTTGWKGEYNLGFTFGKQAEQYFSLTTGAHVQYKSKKSLYLLMANIDLIKSKSQSLVNSGFFHFRYNYKIKNWVRWEAFTQIQYNKMIGIKMRFLLGTGPRFKLVQIEKFKTYLGTLYILEYEISNNSSQKLLQGRFSGYLSFSFNPVKQVEFISTTYYQPRLDNSKDYRITTDNALVFKVYKNFNYYINFRLNLDSRPPDGASTGLTYALDNKFRLDF